MLQVAAAATAAGALIATTAVAATVQVSTLEQDASPYDNPGWVEWERDGGVIEIAADYGAPAGFGSSALVLDTPASNDKAQTFKSLVTDGVGVALADVDEIAYSAYRSSTSTANPVQAPSLNIEIDANGLVAAGGFATLVYEPVYNGYAAYPTNTWTSHDAYNGGAGVWWSTQPIPGVPLAFNSFVPWSAIVAANPDAVVLRIGINQGGGNPGLYGAADAYSFNGTTYDFEAFNPTKDDCKDGGWETNWAAGTFKNQGACVSHFARMD
jgi:hypothetical protein